METLTLVFCLSVLSVVIYDNVTKEARNIAYTAKWKAFYAEREVMFKTEFKRIDDSRKRRLKRTKNKAHRKLIRQECDKAKLSFARSESLA